MTIDCDNSIIISKDNKLYLLGLTTVQFMRHQLLLLAKKSLTIIKVY